MSNVISCMDQIGNESSTSYESRYEKALERLDIAEITEIVSTLNFLPKRERQLLVPFYERIKDDLFSKSIDIPNYDTAKFRRGLSFPPLIGPEPTIENPEEEVAPPHAEIDSSDQTFVKFWNLNRERFAVLRDFYPFIFEAETRSSSPRIVFVCDDQSTSNPFLTTFRANSAGERVEIAKIDDFVNEQTKGDANLDIVVFLFLFPSLGRTDETAVKLQQLFDLPFTIRSVHVLPHSDKLEVVKLDFRLQNDRTKTDILNNTDKVFINLGLPFEVQSIIKAHFKNPGIINYRKLTDGFTGATVYEVQHVTNNAASAKRYVVKIKPKEVGKPLKLELEMENFKIHVRDIVSTVPYHAEYESSDTLEAIFYNYASSDSSRDSQSFNSIIQSNIRNGGKGSSPKDTLGRLFKMEVFKDWTCRPMTDVVSKHFEYQMWYRNPVAAALDTILLKSEADTTDLIEKFDKICSSLLVSKKKPCHGDLHTNNFFDDGEKVVLIDFGNTGENHCLFDHVFLETSIRMKHFPSFVPVNELIEYDSKLMSIDSFDEAFDLSFIERASLRQLYELIIQIRRNAIGYMLDQGAPCEYLVALFISTFRMIYYQNLNQLYAFKLANLLADKILN